MNGEKMRQMHAAKQEEQRLRAEVLLQTRGVGGLEVDEDGNVIDEAKPKKEKK